MNNTQTKKGKYTIITWEDGSIWWTIGGLDYILHREDGPAVSFEGYDEWYLNDQSYNEKEWLLETRRRKLKAMNI